MRKSVRWRLATSFAGIALLATLTLGTVLLTIVRGYYARQERDYLENNAQALASLFGTIAQTGSLPDMTQTQVGSMAFLTQNRIRLLDADEQVIADSGTPQDLQIVSLGVGDGTDFEQPITATVPISDDIVSISREADPLFPAVEHRYGLTVIRGSETAVSDAPSSFRLLVARSPYGFSLHEQSDLPVQRSRQQVRQPIRTTEGTLWGYLELSQGPAYGTQITHSVARGWAVASVVAILLSAAVGWWASRSLSAPLLHLAQTTARMARGDLSARAPETDRQDELGTLAQAFNEMARRVEETVSTLRSFVSDAAHEIHTPLSTIRTNLDLLPTDGAVTRMQTQVARLETLTTDLLDLSRIEAGQVSTQRQLVDIRALLLEIGEVYASRAEQADVDFIPTLSDTDLCMQGDKMQLQRALSNLLDNAVKFTPPGGRVQVSARQVQGQIVVDVEDTGIGIPEDDLPLLFGRFHRGQNAASYPGSGLGLAIVKAVVEGHGGRIDVKSEPSGTRFTVSFGSGVCVR